MDLVKKYDIGQYKTL